MVSCCQCRLYVCWILLPSPLSSLASASVSFVMISLWALFGILLAPAAVSGSEDLSARYSPSINFVVAIRRPGSYY